MSSPDDDKPEAVSLRQMAAIDLLSTGLPIAKAAKQTGIGRRTITRWMNSPAFQAALAQRRQEGSQRFAGEAAELCLLSFAVVKNYLANDDDRTTYEPGRIKLAVQILDKAGILASPSTPKSNPAT